MSNWTDTLFRIQQNYEVAVGVAKAIYERDVEAANAKASRLYEAANGVFEFEDAASRGFVAETSIAASKRDGDIFRAATDRDDAWEAAYQKRLTSDMGVVALKLKEYFQ